MTELVEKQHALLGPSGFHRWGACPGSVELEKPFPNTGSKYARYGTACHELADLCLTKREDAENWVGETFVVEGEEIRVDMVMADLVNEYVSYVETFLDRDAGDVILPEQRVPLAHMTGEKDAEGTSDVVGFKQRPDGRWTIVVVDLKTGQGVPVYAKGNGQLRMYGSGALRKFGALYDIADVQMVIIQPPLRIVDDETITVEELRAFEEEVSIAAGRTQVGGAELVPGEKQCKFCKAKAVCPALRDEVLSTVTASTPSAFRNLDKEPDALPKRMSAEIAVADDTAMLAAQMRAIKLVEDWCKAVRAEVERRTFEGRMPGYKIVQGKAGNRQWSDEAAALDFMKKTAWLKIDDVAPRKVITPSAAEKVFKGDIAKQRRWAKIAPLITQTPGGPSVAPIDDPRPEYAVVSTADSFAAIPAEKPLPESPVRVSLDAAALLS